jgi:hypothetical protein
MFAAKALRGTSGHSAGVRLTMRSPPNTCLADEVLAPLSQRDNYAFE